MWELLLVLMSGVLGSAHCIGMCGPFAIAVGSSTSNVGQNIIRQLIYSSGRLFTYAFAGAVAGFAGMRVVATLPLAQKLPALMAILAGLLLIYQGSRAAGYMPLSWPWLKSPSTAHSHCGNVSVLRTMLTSPSPLDTFLAGMLTGFLPCGLVYAYLAMAASYANLFAGTATMVAFGLGTIPVMVITGCSASMLSVVNRQRLMSFAAWCVVVAGVLSIYRGVVFWNPEGLPAEACPFCLH